MEKSLSNAEINGQVAERLGVGRELASCEHRDCEGDYRDYCGDIGAAQEIIEKIKNGGPFYLHWVWEGYAKGHWWCSIQREHSVCDCDDGHDTEVNNYEAEADTTSMAIALAFLKMEEK